ncbi:hypothetical protein N5D52_27995 [Pseudomonas sp. GD03860]|uniref:hypothetical protein n=1 Tax=Pseudomonas TaxID=286 RepID=UPI002364845B|nr:MULTISPECIES: hypothetical protein [Pseudomonas]MDD2059084.1 hypothetical protein [Pseudomonas putida]MDH0640774.1 hypothetical protein [Pseudomonas sp. GD03860]
MKKTTSTALVVGSSHDLLGLGSSCIGEYSTTATGSTYKYLVKSITEMRISISESCLASVNEYNISSARSLPERLDEDEWRSSRDVLFWGQPPLTANYLLVYFKCAGEWDLGHCQDLARNRDCELYSCEGDLAITHSAYSDLQRWNESVPQCLSSEKKSRKNKSGKLQKKPKRDIADAIADLELHIQKNQDVFESWFSLARQVVIDDGGALAGNKRKRHMS